MNTTRRTFLSTSAGTMAWSGYSFDPEPGSPEHKDIIDTHAYLSRWPARRMWGDEAPLLVDHLARSGVTQAWVSSFDALLHKDLAAVNANVAEQCAKYKLLMPVGSVNPLFPDWREDVRRCQEQFRMAAIRLHPGYHGYTLDHPAFLELLHMCSERRLLLQITAWMEDQRCADPLLRAPDVALDLLSEALSGVPDVRVMVLNGWVQTESRFSAFKSFKNLAFDFARIDGLAELGNMIEAVGLERIVFGSFSPMFYFESAMLKVQEVALEPSSIAAIEHGNARRLLSAAAPGA